MIFLWFETGLEGNYWAFQDNQFISKDALKLWCKKCGKYLDSQKSEKEPSECPDGQHEPEISDSWSYEGLHILKDGDYLRVFSKENPNEIIWEGEIQLRQRTSFDENVFGWRVHSKPTNVDPEKWARWFLNEHPAKFTKKK